MKLKADLHKECPPPMNEAVESAEFRKRIFTEVLVPHLHVPGNWGPAEFYIQECDKAVGAGPMCEVRLTGVSATRARSTDDFFKAREVLENIYAETLKPFLNSGERLQLMVTIMLDTAPFKHDSSLIEAPPRWLVGE